MLPQLEDVRRQLDFWIYLLGDLVHLGPTQISEFLPRAKDFWIQSRDLLVYQHWSTAYIWGNCAEESIVD